MYSTAIPVQASMETNVLTLKLKISRKKNQMPPIDTLFSVSQHIDSCVVIIINQLIRQGCKQQ